jgi:hypothetical protein
MSARYRLVLKKGVIRGITLPRYGTTYFWRRLARREEKYLFRLSQPFSVWGIYQKKLHNISGIADQ